MFGLKAFATKKSTRVNDQSASGHMDIGKMRMQWGRTVSTSDGDETVSFPVPFGNTPTVTATTEITTGAASAWGGTVVSVGTTSFDYNRDDTIANATHNPFIAWFAIGLKP